MHCHRAISRRDFLVSTASATVGTLLGDWPGVARAASGEDDLAELTVAAASAAIRKGGPLGRTLCSGLACTL